MPRDTGTLQEIAIFFNLTRKLPKKKRCKVMLLTRSQTEKALPTEFGVTPAQSFPHFQPDTS